MGNHHGRPARTAVQRATRVTWRMLPATLLPSQFPEDEIHIQHNGTVWLVSSHFDIQHQFETLAEAMVYANHLRDQHRGDERPKVFVHRAASPYAK